MATRPMPSVLGYSGCAELAPTRRLDTFASVPEHLIDEAVRQRFFGEDQ